MSNQKIRTRFAPSPTGHLHIGNARTAIMNWIFALHSGGQFVLRVEDTDKERSTEASEASILEDLKWLGLDWDEGPGIGGDKGPYRQSERLDLYANHLNRLLESGRVYRCYCTPEALEERRKAQVARGEPTQYNGHCRSLTSDQISAYEAEGRTPAYRFKTEVDSITFQDLVRGEITTPGNQLGDFIIARPDGMPMYNFACVIDDHLMQISHVIRGDDHISNTPRQILIYQAFEWELPGFAHIPMILGSDKQRLSKRHGATSVDQYQQQGYLPEALINFLSLLSWSSESGEEILSKDRLIREFSFDRISKSAAVFDTEKLNWMNGMYIRQLDLDILQKRLLPYIKESGFPVDASGTLAKLFQEKIELLSEIKEKAAFLFTESVTPENDEAKAMLHDPGSKQVFQAFLNEIESIDTLDRETFMTIMKSVQKATGIKGKNLWMPVRIALTGQMHGPDLPGIVEFYGIEKVRGVLTAIIR